MLSDRPLIIEQKELTPKQLTLTSEFFESNKDIEVSYLGFCSDCFMTSYVQIDKIPLLKFCQIFTYSLMFCEKKIIEHILNMNLQFLYILLNCMMHTYVRM